MAKKLPKRIKQITPEQLPEIKKYRDLFIIFWLLQITMYFSARAVPAPPGEDSPLALLLLAIGFFAIVFAICALIFLTKTANRLYKQSIGYIIVYLLSFIIPFGGFISLLVLASVAGDSGTALKYFGSK